MKRAIGKLVVVVLLALAGCGRGEGGASSAPSPSPGFGRGRVLIDTGSDSVLLDVEVAETPEQKARGLMHRKSLPANRGMVFIYFEPDSGGFWMKNTLIPLSIAFFDERGKILKILDMEPCERDPCRVYDPGVSYTGALEVNQGAFERWGVQEGDVLQVTR